MRARVAHVVLSLSPGGTERLVIELSKRTREAVAGVICLDQPGAWSEELTDDGIPVVALKREPGFKPALGLAIARNASAFGAAILHCHHYSPFVYGRIASALMPKLRVVFTEHGRLSDAPPSAKRKLMNPLLAGVSDPVYAVSHDLKRHMVASGFPEDRVNVIHNGIDPGPEVKPLDAILARLSLNIPQDAFVLGTVARLDAVKDLGTLLRAVAALRRQSQTVFLAIVGEGPERRSLEELARSLGIETGVRFAGQRDDARALLPAFDLYVNSSISEGISLTLLEAMAACRPIVATRVGGTPEVVVDHVTGLLVPSRSPDCLAGAVAGLMRAAPTRRAMGLAGRARMEREFSLARMVGDYVRVYDAVARP
jgi:glycosyltransferase involved in cell wall biosynthesis